MGFFGKLFEKKICDVCGEEIGLLGNRKLEDGNLCKNCARKLSPWFSDRRESTVAEIKEQLEYRALNRELVNSFHVTRVLGDDTKVYLDEDAGTFMVTSARDYREANPDVVKFSDVTGCTLDIDEDRNEEMREDEEGNKVSYSPPRYWYSYDFHMVIHVNHPYFDKMRFRLNSSDVELRPRGAYARTVNPETYPDYMEYKTMGEEIRQVLTEARQQHREEVREAAAPKAAVTCPWCGATTHPDASGCCEYCGGSVSG